MSLGGPESTRPRASSYRVRDLRLRFYAILGPTWGTDTRRRGNCPANEMIGGDLLSGVAGTGTRDYCGLTSGQSGGQSPRTNEGPGSRIEVES